MGKLTLLQDTWKLGMQRDPPRVAMAQGTAWSLVDYIPEWDAPLSKRGGWAYGACSVSVTTVSASYIVAVRYAPFVAGAKLTCTDEDGKLYSINTSTLVVSDLGAGNVPYQTAFHVGKLIIPKSSGYGIARYYDGTTHTTLTAAANSPSAQFTTVYKDRTILANTNANPTYVYFSAAGDPTTWDLTNNWVSVNRPVTGVTALPGALMVFQDVTTARFRGATPGLDGDLVADDPVFEIGCTDARSIDTKGALCAFANPNGVYLTNGTNLPTDLTQVVGIKQFYQTQLAGYVASTWTLAGGFYQNNYVLSILNAAGAPVDGFVFNLDDFTVWRVSNLPATSFDNATQITEELWFGTRDESRLGRFSTVFTPSVTYNRDADGTAVTPVLETPMYGVKPPGRKTWRELYLQYNMTDSGATDPKMYVNYLKNQDDAYSALSATLLETTARSRKRLAVRLPSDGIGLKITQTNASDKTELFAIEADVHSRESTRLAQ